MVRLRQVRAGSTAARSPLLAPLLTLVLLSLALGACSAPDPSSAPTRPLPSVDAGPGEGAGAGAGTGSPLPTQPPVVLRRKPNLLVIEADDMRSDDLRFMPKTQRLIGDQGLTWHNSFAPDPLCCPSRASFLTGQYSHNHGVLSHVEPYGFHAFDDSRTLATALQSAGYRTALVGKYLNGYGDQPTPLGADSLLYVPPGWTQWWGSTDRLPRPGEFFHGHSYDYFNLGSNVNGQILSWPGRYTTDVTSEQTQDLISSFSQEQPDQPWFVWWTPVAPHHGDPFEADDPGYTARDDGHQVAWVTPARPEEAKGRFDDITRGAGVPADGPSEPDRADKPSYLSSIPPLNPTEREAVAEVTRQRGEALSVLDDEVAETLAHLRSEGQADRTVVVFTSDNGYYLGEHEKRQGKINLHEPSIRVPLLMAGPDIPTGDRFDPVSTVDLAATLVSLAGARLPDLDGADLRGVISTGDRGWNTPVVLEGRMLDPPYVRARSGGLGGLGLNTQGVRLGGWKLVRYSTREAELYDLAKDPLELGSIPGDSAQRARLEAVLRRYDGCAGAACRRPLPVSLRMTPEQNRLTTLAQERATAQYYGTGR